MNTFFCLPRRFGSTESPCERFIGETKYLFDPAQGPTSTALVQRLRARTHGLRGCGADDGFVMTVAQAVFTAERRSHASAIAHHATREQQRVGQWAPWLLDTPAVGASVSPRPAQELRAQVAAARAANEPSALEEADLALLTWSCCGRRPGLAAT